MSKKIRYIIMALLLAVFCTMGGIILYTQYKYAQEDKVYEQAAEEFTRRTDAGAGDTLGEAGEDTAGIPLEVDFGKLREINSDVIGWIYCEDTVINYPVLQGPDNDYYLRRNINRKHQTAGSMFACLDEWKDQEFYESHPVMWLLTPEQDYQILLFAGYTTAATSDTYTTFDASCEELEDYLARCLKLSDFQADLGPGEESVLDPGARYVVLSTCAYNFEDARYVLHGKLEPVER